MPRDGFGVFTCVLDAKRCPGMDLVRSNVFGAKRCPGMDLVCSLVFSMQKDAQGWIWRVHLCSRCKETPRDGFGVLTCVLGAQASI